MGGKTEKSRKNGEAEKDLMKLGGQESTLERRQKPRKIPKAKETER